MGKKLSARLIGKLIGLDAREVNLALREIGYLSGEAGKWSLTEKGRQFGEYSVHSNGYGGYAARNWDYIVWDMDVAYKIGNPDKWLKEVNRNRKKAGLPLIDSVEMLLN